MATEPNGNSDTEEGKKPELANIEGDQELEDGEEENGGDEVAASSDHPVCPRCGWSNTRLSHTKTPLDIVLRYVSLRAFRCRSCGNRFRTFQRRT
jgi:hypothetical protein